ncbi:MAG: amidohydrolase family protein, partial [Verrucomicrobiota bacterium]
MILFENMQLISWNPPAVTGPLDVVAAGSGKDAPGTATGQARRILAVGTGLAARYPDAKRVASGGYLSPGLVLSHTHLYSALARGMMVSIKPSKDFAQQLAHLWWRLDRAIDLPILESSGLAGLADAAFCGVTAVVDHHAGPEAIDGSLSVLRGAYETIGLRGLLCYETTDRNGMEGARAGIAENVRFAREIDAERAAGRRPLVDGAIGGHAGFTVGEETLGALGDAVRSTGRGIHIHLGEDKYDAVDSRHRFGADLVARMDAAGCLGPKSIVGHGVWLTESEVETVNARDAFLAHNARSNMNNAVGYNALLARFNNVILGTDGMSADLLEEFKFAVFRHRETAGPWWPDNFLACMDRGNRLLERYFATDFIDAVDRADATDFSGDIDSSIGADEAGASGDARSTAAGASAATRGSGPTGGVRFGAIEAGSPADLVVWDYDPP